MRSPRGTSRRPSARVVASLACVLTLSSVAAACGSSPKQAGDDVASLGTTESAANDSAATTDNSADTAKTSDETTTDDTATDDSVDPSDAIVDYAKCMREHGFDMPDPQVVQTDSDGKVTGGGPVINKQTSNSSADGQSSEGVLVGPGGAISFDPTSDEYKTADEACHSILDNAATAISIDPEVEAEHRQQMLDYAQCMRDHGIDFPDPTFTDDGRASVQIGRGEDGEAQLPTDDEDFQAAHEACADLIDGDLGLPGPPQGDS